LSYASKESLDDLVNEWGIELKHAVQLIWGNLNLQNLLDFIFKASKYMMGTEARVITNSNFTKHTSDNEMKGLNSLLNYSDDDVGGINNEMYPDTFWIVIRHNLGENCSYLWNKILIQFLGNLENSVDFITDYDETTISIRIKIKSK
jgi:hypothetical protein